MSYKQNQRQSKSKYMISKLIKQKRSFSNQLIQQNHLSIMEQSIEFSPRKRNKKNTKSTLEAKIGNLTKNKYQQRVQKKYYVHKNQTSFFPSTEQSRVQLYQEDKRQMKEKQNLLEEQPRKQSIFVSQYRQNLRRTVYNQTKMQAKIKKKQTKDQLQNMHSIYNPQFQKNKILMRRTMVPRQSSYDSIIKTTGYNKNMPDVTKNNKDLGINRFPLLARKHKAKAMQELLTKLPSLTIICNKQCSDSEQICENISKFTKRQKRDKGQKHEIKPWQTFHDQFLD